MSVLMKALKQAERQHQDAGANGARPQPEAGAGAGAGVTANAARKPGEPQPAFASIALAIQDMASDQTRTRVTGAAERAPAAQQPALSTELTLEGGPDTATMRWQSKDLSPPPPPPPPPPPQAQAQVQAHPTAAAANHAPEADTAFRAPATRATLEAPEARERGTELVPGRLVLWGTVGLAALGVAGWLSWQLLGPTGNAGQPSLSIAAVEPPLVDVGPALAADPAALVADETATGTTAATAATADEPISRAAAGNSDEAASPTTATTAAATLTTLSGAQLKPPAVPAPTVSAGSSASSKPTPTVRPSRSQATRARAPEARAANDRPRQALAVATRKPLTAKPAAVAAPEPALAKPGAADVPIRLRRDASRGETVHGLLERGYSALAANDSRAAQAAYEEALRLDRNRADAWVGLASIAMRAGDAPKAQRMYSHALEADPSNVAARTGLLAMAGGADPVAEESQLRTMIADSGAQPALWYALGNALARQQRWPDAQQAYFSAVSGDATQPDYAFNLAVSLDRMRQPRAALDYYRRALKLVQSRPARFDGALARARVDALAARLDVDAPTRANRADQASQTN